jgi:drug/metabolite transporter (DMT)-like permease
MSQNRWVPYVSIMLSVVFWGLSFVGTKIALESFTPFTLIFLRFSGASCFVLVFMLYRGFPQLTRREHGRLFLAALFQPGVYFLCETTGLQFTTASKASLIVATIPLAVLGLSAVFLRERFNWTIIAGIGLSLGGVAMLIFGDPSANWSLGGPMRGDLLMFGAVMAMAIYTVLLKSLADTRPAVDITSLQILYGALLFAPAFFWQLPTMDWPAVTARSLVALVSLTLFATIGAFLFFNYALSKIPATRSAIFLNCVPVVTTIGAWLVLGERLTLLQIMGGGLVLLAVYLTNFLGDRAIKVEFRKLLPIFRQP